MTQISEELMMKFITNRCSNEELRTVQQWIDESEDLLESCWGAFSSYANLKWK